MTAIAGALCTAPLARAIGSARVFAVIGAAWATLPLSLILVPSWWSAGLLLAGWAQGATVTLVFATIAERTADARESAWLSGRVQIAGYGAGTVGPFLFSALAAATGSWVASLIVVAVAALMIGVGGVCAVASRPVRRRRGRGPHRRARRRARPRRARTSR